ncbi:MAG: COX15/CtaA family protein [Gammaproteobacteria bacterium]|nr:COX15/CtaA family protein [Gammaproteobacteria bacterium]MDE2347343.1 COX15/CtaA family protein [Gammaproteobacteria bacterium]
MQPQQRVLWFRRLALAGAALAAVVIVLGAWVRLTDAGLGCPDWPGCYGHVFPRAGQGFGKALHEMIHRYFATTLGVVIVSLLSWAVANRKIRGQPLAPAIALFVIVCIQGALGALTVTLLLTPLIVTSHLLGGMTTLSILWWLSMEPERRDLSERERGLRKFAIACLVILIMQIALGGWTSTNYAAVACPDLPTCQDAWWPRHMDFRDAFVLWRGLNVDYDGGILANPARIAIHLTHRIGAVVTGTALITLGLATMGRATTRRLRRAGMLLILAVLLQICIGLAMVHWGFPLALATMHNGGAALLLLALVALLRSLWPSPAIAMVPLGHVDRPR